MKFAAQAILIASLGLSSLHGVASQNLRQSRNRVSKSETSKLTSHSNTAALRELQDDTAPVVDWLVVYTNGAMCAAARQPDGCSPTDANRAPVEAKIRGAADYLNTALQLSGVVTRINVVHLHAAPTGYRTDDKYAAKRDLGGATDPAKPLGDIAALRDSVGADQVVIIWSGGTGGIADKGGTFGAISGSHSNFNQHFSHEAVHMLGCSHDDGYGALEFRTLIALEGGTRVQRVSTTHSLFQGKPIGDEARNCAAKIDNLGPHLSKKRDRPSAPAAPAPAVCNDHTRPDGGDWHDLDSPEYTCAWYANDSNCASYGGTADFANFGFVANDACCACGGGVQN